MHDYRGYKYQLTYHLAWGCYHQMELLDENSGKLLQTVFKKACMDNNMVLLDYVSTKNYVYLVIDCTPVQYIPNILKLLKSVSAKYLLKENEYVKQHGKQGVWDNFSIVGTNDEVLEEMENAIVTRRKNRIKRNKKGEKGDYETKSNEEVDQ